MYSRWAYILIGDDLTGKTTFQRALVNILCEKKFKRLNRNTKRDVTDPRAPRKFRTIFTMNRSIQEQWSQCGSVAGFFKSHFDKADVCILSSHSSGTAIDDVRKLIEGLHERFFDVAAVFFSNNIDKPTADISQLPWQERFMLDNPVQHKPERIAPQLSALAARFAELLIRRSDLQ